MSYIAPVQITHSSVAGSAPTASQVKVGSLVLNVTDGFLYTKDYLGVVRKIEGTPVADHAITLVKMAQIATASLLGRSAAATGDVEVLTAAQVKTLLSLANVDNTSDATKNAAAATLANKTLTAPLISQIVFPATQVPSADANTLDDYEEGTWDAVVTTDGVDFTSVTYQFQRCNYVKIGRLVFVYGLIRTSACTIGPATGSIKLSGFPFTSCPTGVGYYRAAIACCAANVSTSQIQALQQEPGTALAYPFTSAGNVISASSMGLGANGFNMVIGGCYMTA